jgi:hypothetical protein
MLSFEEMQKEMAKKLEAINNIIEKEIEEKATMCVGEIQSRTTVKTGNLRRSMTHGNVEKMFKIYNIKIGSSLPYAQAVEEGHFQEVGRYVPSIGKKLKKSFVPGRHMMGDSIEIYQRELNRSIEDRIKSEVFK